MTALFTSIETRIAKALKPCAGVVVCGQQVGMNQAAAHAINPRDPGRPGFM